MMITTKKTKYLIQIFAFAFIFFVAVSPVLASQITVDNIIKYVNESRESQGLYPLSENEKLNEAAQKKLNDMIENKYFSHTSPAGVEPWHWFSETGYDYKYAGENLAINFETAEAQHKAWMKSPTHRKNILNTDYREIGVAVGAGEIGGETAIITVQEFGAVPGAGIPMNDEKNFSGKGNKNLMEEGVKITPQVLSIKNSASQETKNTSSFGSTGKGLVAIEITSNIFMMLFFISLTLLPIAFLSVAVEKIMIINKVKNKI